ncbi:MAG: hypothetical protein WBQ34_03210 [Candidatus Acidiferrales bacterium]
MRAAAISLLAVLLAAPIAIARQAHRTGPDQTSDFQRDVDLYPEALLAANQSMFDARMDADPHVYATVLRSGASGDAQRAQEILDILRRSMANYKNYRVAVADGYQPFMLKTEQRLYWFISNRNAYASAYEFNPGHPTSLLYKKTKGTFELEGAVFTAPKTATESQLNDRVPLSVARWHENVNLCVALKRAAKQAADLKKFGLDGTIVTKDACAVAGGRWVPQVFGWMVAVFPSESDPSAIWPQ